MKSNASYRWFILVLTALTFATVISGPGASLAVLFEEIAADLHLDLVQIGLIWGIGSLLAIFTGLISGALIDRFGPKRVLLAGIVLVGSTTALRGLAGDFSALMTILLVAGGLVPLISTSGFKISGLWFPHWELGLANGILAMGMALGLVLGSLLGATVLSPWLGNWRHTMFFFGALAVPFAILWVFLKAVPEAATTGKAAAIPMRQALSHILKKKELWLLGLTFLGIGSCQQGMAGYLALHLRGIGWPDATADSAVSLIYVASLLLILPIGFLSDRLGSRKMVLIGALTAMAAGSGLLAAAGGWCIWAAVVLAGMTRDGSAALVLTMAVETGDVGPLYAGTATGFVMTFFFLGNLVSPPIGNNLAEIAPGAPFLFWAGTAALGIVSLLFIKSGSHRMPPQDSSAAA
ncbi:MAG: MFS transporter [Anaerolineales bacterium]|nr:MFS transporter [Anaerolineales bacterium]